jgi:hypothetical protein
LCFHAEVVQKPLAPSLEGERRKGVQKIKLKMFTKSNNKIIMFIYSQGIIVYCIKSFGAAKVSAIWPSVRSHRGIASKDAMLEHVHGRIHSIAGSPLRARGRIERFFRGYGKKCCRTGLFFAYVIPHKT